MDIFAHGLWTGAIYQAASLPPRQKKNLWLAVFFGVAPDLFSFGIYTAGAILGVTRIPFEYHAEPTQYAGLVPAYIHMLYNLTHSLVVFAAAFLLIALILRRPVWEMLAWGIHILIDIPTHTSQFFPTPFLWPLSHFTVSGISWGTPWFLALNYTALLAAYAFLWRVRRRTAAVDASSSQG